MPTRIKPLKTGESPDGEVNKLLKEAEEGWWKDSNMFGVIGRRPELLKTIVPVFVSFFAKGLVEPYIFELCRLKVGEINACTYCSTVRSAAVADQVQPKEACIVGYPWKAEGLTKREALAVKLAEKISLDPHSVDDVFFEELKRKFTEDEIVLKK